METAVKPEAIWEQYRPTRLRLSGSMKPPNVMAEPSQATSPKSTHITAIGILASLTALIISAGWTIGAVEVEDYARAGADAVLVGEGVATADDHELAVERLVKAGAQVKASETTPLSEHQGPYWGQFGGRYVPEALITALDELERVYTQAKADPEFHKEFMTLQQRYVEGLL